MAYNNWQLLHSLSLHLIIVCISVLTIPAINCMPPASPVNCNATGCTLSNAYGVWGDRKDCSFPQIVYPKTEQDIVSAVASASKSKLKVKVVSKFSHTIPKLACPGTGLGNSMVISTENYNSAIEINSEKMSVTVDSGVGLRDLIDTVSKAGLSLVASPYWEGVSIGGMISTGAHGSSWWGRGGAVHDHVVGMSLVVPGTKQEGYAKVIRLNGQDLLLNAAKLSLGLLGVISKVRYHYIKCNYKA